MCKQGSTVAEMSFDVKSVRAAYPALSDGYAYLDGAAGTQVPVAVIAAIADAYRSGLGNVGGAFPASHRSDGIVADAWNWHAKHPHGFGRQAAR